MNDFDYVALIIAIPLGLTMVEIAQGISTTLRKRNDIRVGWMTPLLALILIENTALVWGDIWDSRAIIDASIGSIMLAMFLSIGYYIAASFIFPHDPSAGSDLDDWFMDNRKISLGFSVALITIVDFTIFSTSPFASIRNFLGTMLVVFVFLSPLWVAVLAKRRKVVLWALIVGNVPFFLIAYAQHVKAN